MSDVLRWIASLFNAEVRKLSRQVDDLKAAVAVLQTQVAATKVNEDALKAKLELAISDNASKAEQITDLEADLAAALAATADPADAPAIEQATVDIMAASQALADAVAVDSPSN